MEEKSNEAASPLKVQISSYDGQEKEQEGVMETSESEGLLVPAPRRSRKGNTRERALSAPPGSLRPIIIPPDDIPSTIRALEPIPELVSEASKRASLQRSISLESDASGTPPPRELHRSGSLRSLALASHQMVRDTYEPPKPSVETMFRRSSELFSFEIEGEAMMFAVRLACGDLLQEARKGSKGSSMGSSMGSSGELNTSTESLDGSFPLEKGGHGLRGGFRRLSAKLRRSKVGLDIQMVGDIRRGCLVLPVRKVSLVERVVRNALEHLQRVEEEVDEGWVLVKGDLMAVKRPIPPRSPRESPFSSPSLGRALLSPTTLDPEKVKEYARLGWEYDVEPDIYLAARLVNFVETSWKDEMAELKEKEEAVRLAGLMAPDLGLSRSPKKNAGGITPLSLAVSPISSVGLTPIMGRGDILPVVPAHGAVGVSLQGSRDYNEDRISMIARLVGPVLPQNEEWGQSDVNVPVAYYGVFDGHRGAEAAEFAAMNLGIYLARQMELVDKSGLIKSGAVRRAFRLLNRDLLFKSDHHKFDSGSTALVALITGGEMVVAHAGDSRAVLCRKGQAVTLTRDHKPDTEREAIKARGGVTLWLGTWRVNGVLAVGRAFGDYSLAKYISCEPDVKRVTIEPSDAFVIMATDGLWDVITAKDAVQFVLRKCPELGKGKFPNAKRQKKVTEALTKRALELGSRDNVSVIIVFFHHSFREAMEQA